MKAMSYEKILMSGSEREYYQEKERMNAEAAKKESRGGGGEQCSGHCPPPTSLPCAQRIPAGRHHTLSQVDAGRWEQSAGGKWVHMPWVARGPVQELPETRAKSGRKPLAQSQ